MSSSQCVTVCVSPVSGICISGSHELAGLGRCFLFLCVNGLGRLGIVLGLCGLTLCFALLGVCPSVDPLRLPGGAGARTLGPAVAFL